MLAGRPLIHVGAGVLVVVGLVVAVASDNTDLQVGLFGLAGTLIGALTAYEAAQGAARRDQQARRRSAGRLLQEDLGHARTRCRLAVANGKFWAPRHDLFMEGWERYREVVSQELASDTDWRAVAQAFAAMRSVQSRCDSLRRSCGDDRPVIDKLSRTLIDRYLELSPAAIDALRRLSGDRPADEEITAGAEA